MFLSENLKGVILGISRNGPNLYSRARLYELEHNVMVCVVTVKNIVFPFKDRNDSDQLAGKVWTLLAVRRGWKVKN